ncbi:MAG: hypothetical protein IJA07_03680 [Agathobacter sp.]|nr:hypothetical protein [Agathobacter sp.]
MEKWRINVEYRDRLFQKTPFYMTYPMQNLYLTEMEYEKDMERMKELYPKEVLQLQQMVERRCDEMEYEGSRMYDENPDRYMLEREAQRLLEEFLRQNPQYGSMAPPPPRPETPMMRPERPMNPVPPRPMPRNEEDLSMQQYGRGREHAWLRSLIGILFHDEIYRRRCRHRRCSRWW